MYAVVTTGGKQAKVEKASLLAVEKLDAKVGDTVSLAVLMIADGDRVLATPSEVAGASVTAEVLEHFKGDKQMIFKFKKRKGYKRTKGHRQSLTSLRIVDIVVSGTPAKASKKAEAAAEKPAAAAKKPAAAAKKPAAAPKKADAAAEKTAPVEKKVAAEPKKAASAAKKPAAASKKAEPGQCAAIKSDGTRCTNKAKEGSKYCGVHAKYEG